MTWRYARAAFYTCDRPGCDTEADGFDDRLPHGWIALHTNILDVRPVVHYCPACALWGRAPEESRE